MKPFTGVEALVQQRPWLVRGMLVACSLSLLATSPEHESSDPYVIFTKQASAPRCTLTAEAPSCDIVVTLRHDQAASFFVTERASANVHGVITAQGVAGEQPFVAVHVASDDQPGANDLRALTEFSVARSLNFSGRCAPDAPGTECVSEFTVSFQRSDLGERGGTLHVDWRLDLEASSAHGVDAGAGEVPWTVEYTGP